jgi:dTDP-glucose pyrophosphorylase
MKPSLLILAAGMGARYGGLKQLDPVGPRGELLLDYAVFDAIRAGFGKIIFLITHAMEDIFRRTICSRYKNRIDIVYVFQELSAIPPGYVVPQGRVKPWGTGHAILAAREVIQEPFAIINGDDFYGPRSYQILAGYLRALGAGRQQLAMAGFRVENALSDHGKVSRGVCTVHDGFLTDVVEREEIYLTNGIIRFNDKNNHSGEIPAGTLVSMNLWGFVPQTLFPYLQKLFQEFMQHSGSSAEAEFYIPSVINQGIQEGIFRVKVLETPEQWVGLTYPQDKIRVQALIRDKTGSGIYPQTLFS